MSHTNLVNLSHNCLTALLFFTVACSFLTVLKILGLIFSKIEQLFKKQKTPGKLSYTRITN